MPSRPGSHNRYAQQIRQPGKVRRLSREEIEREYPTAKTGKDSYLTTSYRGPCEKGEEQVYIYGLADPRDHRIRYVGKTKMGLGERLDWHIREPTNRRMSEWLGELWFDGLRPEIAVLEICHASKWESAERSWISRMRKVTALLNVEDGGEACYRGDRGPHQIPKAKRP